MCNRLIRLFERNIFNDLGIKYGITSEPALKKHLNKIYNKSVYTYIVGERDNPTDSGYLMCRYYRRIGIPEGKIVHPRQLPDILNQKSIKSVFFFDDLIGSGRQTKTFWTTPLIGFKLEELAMQMPHINFCYLVLAATKQGLDNVKSNCKNLNIIVGELLGDDNCVFNPNSKQWIDQAELDEFKEYYEVICNKTGISKHPDFKKGFGELGLSIAFAHGIPNSSLPIYWWEDDWKPLIRRG